MSRQPVSSQHTVTWTFRPTDAILSWLYSLLGGAIALYLITMAVRTWALYQHPSLATATPGTTLPSHVMPAAMGLACVSCMDYAVWIAWTVLFLIWAYRAAINVRAVGATGAIFSPGLTVVCLLPLINLVMAAPVMSELVVVAERGDERPRRGLVISPMAVAWWLCLLGAFVVNLATGPLTSPELGNLRGLLVPLAVVQAVLGAGHLALTWMLVRRVQGAIDRRATALASPHPREPWEL